ncbi:MAG: excisionase family DNA-binding protein [Acidobacteriota bacterium]
MDEFLRVEEAGKLLKLTRGAVYTAVARRQLPFVRLGRRIRFRRSDLERHLAQTAVPAEKRN